MGAACSSNAHGLNENCGRRLRRGRARESDENLDIPMKAPSSSSQSSLSSSSSSSSELSIKQMNDRSKESPVSSNEIMEQKLNLKGNRDSKEGSIIKKPLADVSNLTLEKATDERVRNLNIDEMKKKNLATKEFDRTQRDEVTISDHHIEDKISKRNEEEEEEEEESEENKFEGSEKKDEKEGIRGSELDEKEEKKKGLMDQKLAKLKEGVDFIQTEEDVEAVESAVVKIQSTFRGKKFRSKLNQKQDPQKGVTTGAKIDEQGSKSIAKKDNNNNNSSKLRESETEKELNEKLSTMQVNDKSSNDGSGAHEPQKAANPSNLPEDEAERAATKIQAGFKGYKTRKELDGKLGGTQSTPGHSGSVKEASK